MPVFPYRLYWYEVQEDDGINQWRLKAGPESACSGIFDLRWLPPEPQQPPVLALALADGTVKLVAPPASSKSSTGGTPHPSRNNGQMPPDAQESESNSNIAADNSASIGTSSLPGQAHADHGGSSWTDIAAADIAHDMVLTVDWSRHPGHRNTAVASTSSGHLATMQVPARPGSSTPFNSCVMALSYYCGLAWERMALKCINIGIHQDVWLHLHILVNLHLEPNS